MAEKSGKSKKKIMGNKRKAKRGHEILAKPKKKVTQTTGLETEEAFVEKPERNKSGLIWKETYWNRQISEGLLPVPQVKQGRTRQDGARYGCDTKAG
jgi:hypothetical protein